MRFNDVLENKADQAKGRDLHLFDPFTGEKTGMVLTIAGPDSDIARRSRLQLADELAEAADADGVVRAEDRERARIASLARLVIAWSVEEAPGKSVPFNTRNVTILLGVQWVQEQADAFAASRRHFAPEAV